MHFRILGPLEVRDGDRGLPLGGAKQRALLGVLLLHAGEVVSADRLVAELWGERAPRSAAKLVQTYVSALRKVLGPAAIETRPPGYVARAGELELDASRFRAGIARAREEVDPTRAAAALGSALALWRGRPVADVLLEGPSALDVERLEELRLEALELKAGLDLEVGRHAQLVSELEALVALHPFRERLRALLMLALYRGGRQADALSVYARTRKLLADELGLEPGEELQRLERQVLAHDPALAGPPALDQARRAAPVPASAPVRDLRKTVTVLFADVADFTELGEELDPETLRAAMTRYFDAMRAVVERHGGTVEKFVGDEVMAVFGVPRAHEDDALRAVRAADEMQRALAALNDELGATHGVRLAVRIGINTGIVLASDASAGQAFVTGDAVNVGKRLEQAAAAGEVVIGAATMALVQGAVVAERLAPLVLKGKAAPVEVYRLAVVAESVPGFTRGSGAPLVGRAAELTRLRAAFDEAATARRCVVATVVGEAGIGKTRLVDEMIAQVGAEARVLVGRCIAYGDGATFLPMVEVLAQAPQDVVAAAAATHDALAGAASTYEIFRAFRGFLEAAAARLPVVLVLDDVHWAEAPLLDLVEYLDGFVVDAPLLVVCVARPELLSTRAGWQTPISLAPLAPDAAAALLDQLGSATAAPTRALLTERADGNPLYLEQLHAFVTEGGDPQELPATIEALLAARLDQLEPEARTVLETAAVVGREFWRGAVEHLRPPVPPDRLVAELLALVRAGLVDPDRSLVAGEDAFRFHHALIRDAAYRAIPKRTRVDLHERCAEWTDGIEGENDELVGYHLEQAHRLRSDLRMVDDDVARRAGEALARAGTRARARCDFPAARDLLGRALALLPDDHPAYAQAEIDLVGVLIWEGDVPAAAALVGAGIERARLRSDDRRALFLRLHRAYLEYRHDLAPAEDSDALVAESIALFADAADARGLGLAWEVAATAHGVRSQLGPAADAYAEAIRLARQVGDRFAEATSFAGLNMALTWGPLPLEAALVRLRAHLAAAADHPVVQANTLLYTATAEAYLGRFAEARTHFRCGFAIVEALGQSVPATMARADAALFELLAGNLDAAEAELRSVAAALERLGVALGNGSVRIRLAEVLYRQGRYAEAEAAVPLDDGDESGDVDVRLARRSIRAKLLAQRGRLDEAVALAREAAAEAATTDCLLLRADVTLDLADVLSRAGCEEEAERAARDALDLYEGKGATVAAERVRGLATPATAR